MTNKVLAIIFAVFAVLLYTMAVIDFTQGHVADGIGNLLFAASDTLMAYAMLRIERQREALARITALLFKTFKAMEDGIEVEVVKQTDTETETETTEELDEHEMLEDISRKAEEIAKLKNELEATRNAFKESERINKHLGEELKESERKLSELRPASDSLPHYCPTVEQIKSVYAAAGVMEQVHEHTDAKNLNELWEGLKEWHKQNGGKEIEV
jgi:septal ring factor EnvC (AmiA/AmiB activator)